MSTKRTKSIADSLLPKPEAKRDLDLNALEMQVRAIHQQAEAAATPPPPVRNEPPPPPAEKMYRLSIDLPESLYFKMKETLGRRRPSVTNRAFVVDLIESELLKSE